MECAGCGIKDELVIVPHLIVPKNLGGVNDSSNEILLCANCERKISIIGDKFKVQFKKLSKIGISKEPAEFSLIKNLSESLKNVLLKELNAWITKELKNGKILIEY